MHRYCFIILWLMLAIGLSAQAQPSVPPAVNRSAVWDTTVSRFMIVGSANSALLLADSIPDVGYVSFGGGLDFGTLRRPQEAKARQAIVFQAERYQHVGRWLFHGTFAYRNDHQQDVQWTDIMEPYRGTPFVLADSTVGDWKKHHFLLEAGVSIPLGKDLTVGLQTEYRVGSGAKNRDPRPLSNTNEITLIPSISWSASKRHRLGAHAYYRSFKEDIGILIRAPFVQGLYRLKGLSFHDQILPISSTHTRDYRGSAWGGGIQHLYQSGHALQLVSEMSYIRYSETTQDGSIPPRPAGDFRNDDISASVSLRHKSGFKESTLWMTAHLQKGVGHEYHYVSGALVFDGDMYRQQELYTSMGYEWMKRMPGALYTWYIKPSLGYRRYRASYPSSPVTSRQAFSRLTATVEGGIRVARQVEVKGSLQYGTALDEQLTVQSGSGNEYVTSVLLLPDQEYHTADYLSGMLGLRHNFACSAWKTADRRFFVEISGRLRRRLSTGVFPEYGPYRAYTGLTIGMFY